jgi:hypothetical protein
LLLSENALREPLLFEQKRHGLRLRLARYSLGFGAGSGKHLDRSLLRSEQRFPLFPARECRLSPSWLRLKVKNSTPLTQGVDNPGWYGTLGWTWDRICDQFALFATLIV